MCVNTPGSFTCLLPQVNANPASNPRLVQFSCGQAVCNLGQDCITINGVPPLRRSMPTLHHPGRRVALHQTSRRTAPCTVDTDVNWQGWYRMYLGGVSVQMPERCVVQGAVCGSWVEGCCNFEFPINVKACPGNYYVYKFVKPPLCFLAYAADANTKVCATCREGTSCMSADKITWTCQTQGEFSAPPNVPAL
ncbi:hypothetical protein SRHO_G00304170 [Serrasalmus rhombeus]